MTEELYRKYLDSNRLISTDTRNITAGCMFFALKGESFDGNKFAGEAINKGAKYAVIDNPEYRNKNTVLVKDVLSTLQKLANYHRNHSTFKVLGLTGSNGKTTTKELIYSVLSKKFKCSATKGNLNNHIGVPLTILATPNDTEVLIVEMGANHQGEIKALCEIAEPGYGLITNIGRAHLEGFGGYEGVLKAKSELYNHLIKSNNPIFVNQNDELLVSLLRNYENKIPYGTDQTICYTTNNRFTTTLSLDLVIENQDFHLETKMFGKYNLDNILTAASVGNYFGVPSSDITEAIAAYEPENNRSQVKKTEKNILILDSYNANPSSMNSALRSFKEMEGENKMLILGGMKELGTESKIEHEKLVRLIGDLKIEEFYLVGEEFSSIIPAGNNVYNSTEQLAEHLRKSQISNSLIFIKGSRANKLESLVECL